MKRRNEGREMTIRPGTGTMCGQIGRHFYVSARSPLRRDHAWKYAEMGDDGVTLSLGLVNGNEPYLAGRLMSGKNPDGTDHAAGPPVLMIDPNKFNVAGRSWICVRLRVDADFRLLTADVSPETLAIVQSPTPLSDNEFIGLKPVVAIRMVNGATEYRQICFFDFQHSISRPATGRVRHFFDPE